jgi:hypothetical protein
MRNVVLIVVFVAAALVELTHARGLFLLLLFLNNNVDVPFSLLFQLSKMVLVLRSLYQHVVIIFFVVHILEVKLDLLLVLLLQCLKQYLSIVVLVALPTIFGF